jgi:formate hydrogenlyase subunit 3/multisubunit Na+/H+ antiporter MnhD subunit
VNDTGVALTVALAAAGVAAVAGLLMPAGWRARTVGGLIAGSGVAAVLCGVTALVGGDWHVELPDLLPLVGMRLSVDALSGWFLVLVGAVTAAGGVYTIGYAGRDGHGPGSRSALVAQSLFTGAMLLVPAAASVPTFLFGWELMAVTSLLLVMTEHRHREQTRPAAIWYAAMTQAGFVTVLIGLVWLASVLGGDFATIRAAVGQLSPTVKNAVFLSCLFGFAAKAGAVPLHVWLPRAHAEAPSHVSALMSAAMVKLGLYGLLRVGFDLLGGGSSWWWLTVVVLGALSALYGIVQAVVATDLKRLLAFSTCENIGLILLGVGFAGLFAAADRPAVAALALAAALLHMLNHAAFKALLFFGAGSVVSATGTRDLDALGGLARRMPATTTLFTVGALAAAALPPGNGFVSEWLLLQSLLHPDRAGTVLAIAAPVAVAVIALTAGVGVATYVKALGTGFLARPRSDAAAAAIEAPWSMLTAMGLAAAACAMLAVVPGLTVPAMARVSAALGLRPPPVGADVTGLRLTGLTATFWPLSLAIGLVVVTGAVAVLARGLGRSRRRRSAWDCGGGPLTPRMEYTATSYAEPLQRVFDDALAPERDVDVTHDEESAYHLEAIRFRQRIPDRIENRLYRPVIDAVVRLGDAARRLAPGVIHRSLASMLTALIAVLLAGVIR